MTRDNRPAAAGLSHARRFPVIVVGMFVLAVMGAILFLLSRQSISEDMGASNPEARVEKPAATSASPAARPRNSSPPRTVQKVTQPTFDADTIICVIVLSREGLPESEAQVTVAQVGKPKDGGNDLGATVTLTLQTDSDGRSLFRGLPNGDYLIASRKDTRAAHARVVLGEDRSEVEQTLILAEAQGIAGRVLGSQGQPIAGARIAVFQKNYRPGPKVSTTSEADGTFRFTAMPPGLYQFVAEADGYAPGFSKVTSPGAQIADIVLTRGGRISGIVRRVSDKMPVAGIAVGAQALQADRTIPSVASDAAGRFTLDGLSGDTYVVFCTDKRMVLASAEPRVDIQSDRTVNNLELWIEMGARISGRVFSEKTQAPMEGVHVGAVLSNGFRGVGVATDAAGCYILDGLPPGEFQITFTWRGNTRVLSVTLPPGTPEVIADFPWVERTAVSGTVVGPDGVPVLNASVRIWLPFERTSPWSDSAQTDAQGVFRLMNCQPAEQALIKATSDRGTSKPLAPFAIPESGIEGLALKLEPVALGSVSGTVVDTRGTPALARVRLTPRQRDVSDIPLVKDGFSEADGFFLIRGVPAGEYDIRVGLYGEPQSSTLPVQDAGSIALRPGERRRNLRLTIDAGLAIDGTVTDETGAPVPFATVAVYAPGDPPVNRNTRTDPFGYFSLPALSAGIYDLVAVKEGVGRDRKLNVTAGQSVDLVLSQTDELEPIDADDITIVRPLP